MKNGIKPLFLALLCTLSSHSFADSAALHLDLGLSSTILSNNQEISLVKGLTHSYVADDRNQKGEFFGFGMEYYFERLISSPLILSMGLSGYRINLGDLNGIETPFVNGGLTDTLLYTAQARSSLLMLEPKITLTTHAIQPYIFAGIGYAWNTLQKFSETTPPGSTAAPGNPYSDHTKQNIATELGLGLQYVFGSTPTKQYALHIEYQHFNLGTLELGNASGQTTNDRLTVQSSKADIFNLGFMYRFN